MLLLHPRAAGLDVHKDQVTVCLRTVAEDTSVHKTTKVFDTTTLGLDEMALWLSEERVSITLMESTGVYWKTVYFALCQHDLEIVVANARHARNLPGRKSDQRDADWLSDLAAHGLLKPSFIPPPEIDALRNLARLRVKLIQQRTAAKNRTHKLLQECGIKLSSVATDIFGASGRAMLKALIEGERDVAVLAQMAKGRMRRKIEQLELALQGRFTQAHAILLRMFLDQIDLFDRQIGQLDEQLAESRQRFTEEIEQLCSLPGVKEVAALAIIGEIGVDMDRFGSVKRLTSWAGTTPGENESAGKRRSSRTRKANRYLRRILIQCAWAASKTQTRVGEKFRRLQRRIGGKKAAMAVARHLLELVYCLFSRGEKYNEEAYQHHYEKQEERRKKYAVKVLEKLGYSVSLETLEEAPAVP